MIVFTHYWISGFGWENTIFLPEDFVEVEEFGRTTSGEVIFIAINDKGGKHIFKGFHQ